MKQLAAAIPFDAQGRGLFDVNIKYGCRVTPIGGKVDDTDFSPRAAAVREARDEFGLRLKIIGNMGSHNTVSKGEGPFPVETFAAEIVDASEAVMENDTVRALEPTKSAHAVWLSLQELFELGDKNMLAPNLHSMILGWHAKYESLYGKLPGNLTLRDLYMTVNTPGERELPDDDDPFANGMVRIRFRATGPVAMSW